MRISLIGMSNIGKSSCAQLLAEAGYTHVDCDALIEKRLEAAHEGASYNGIGDIAGWMGYPYSPQYEKNSALYLKFEGEVMHETLAFLENHRDAPVVIDTTGSVIYLDPALLSKLRSKTRIVYLEPSEEQMQNLFSYYYSNPKPVIWNDCYAPQEGEAPEAALKRCYPALLRARAEKYKNLAHHVIPVEEMMAHKGNLRAFFEAMI